MRWTGTSERIAKNWFAGSHGPAGEHLIESMRHPDEVFIAVLKPSEREYYRLALEIKDLHSALYRIIAVFEDAI